MSFNTWLEKKANKEIEEKFNADVKKSKGLIAENLYERIITLYSIYSTRNLVIATWVMAIGAISLSAWTLIMK